MTFFVLYLLMILENVQSFLNGIAVITGIAILAITFGRAIFQIEEGGFEDFRIFPGYIKGLIATTVLCALLSNLIPSKQDMAIIAAGGVTYNLVTSDSAKDIGNKGVELLNKKLESMLEDPVKAAKEGKAVVEEVSKK